MMSKVKKKTKKKRWP